MEAIKFIKFLLVTALVGISFVGAGVIFLREFPYIVALLIAIASLIMSKFYGDYIKTSSLKNKVHQKDIFFLAAFSMLTVLVFSTFNISLIVVNPVFYIVPAICFTLLFYRILNEP